MENTYLSLAVVNYRLVFPAAVN